MISSETAAKMQSALPFWLSFLLIPAIWLVAFSGGWWVLVIPVMTRYLFTALDIIGGLNLEKVGLGTEEEQLSWYVLLMQCLGAYPVSDNLWLDLLCWPNRAFGDLGKDRSFP